MAVVEACEKAGAEWVIIEVGDRIVVSTDAFSWGLAGIVRALLPEDRDAVVLPLEI